MMRQVWCDLYDFLDDYLVRPATEAEARAMAGRFDDGNGGTIEVDGEYVYSGPQTSFDGRLVRVGRDRWTWSDGEPAAGVHDILAGKGGTSGSVIGAKWSEETAAAVEARAVELGWPRRWPADR
jgi:hypothetical protein